MLSTLMSVRFDNPFATRWTAPGAVPYLFPPGENGAQLIERLRQLGWCAAIIGPHGCGKSTLLAWLKPRLQDAGRDVVHVVLRKGEQTVPRDVLDQVTRLRNGQLIVDGWEQLRPWKRWHVGRFSGRFGRGLLVTSHARPRLPVLVHVKPNQATARKIVARLVAKHNLAVPETVIDASFQACSGNVREMLFDLYNWYERNRRKNR